MDAALRRKDCSTKSLTCWKRFQPFSSLCPSHLLTRGLPSSFGINCFSASFTSVGTLPVWVSGSLEGSGAALQRKWQTVKWERAIPSTCSLFPGAVRGCQLASVRARAGLCTAVLSKPIYRPARLLRAFSAPAGFRHGFEMEADQTKWNVVMDCERWWRTPEHKPKMKTNYNDFFFLMKSTKGRIVTSAPTNIEKNLFS